MLCRRRFAERCRRPRPLGKSRQLRSHSSSSGKSGTRGVSFRATAAGYPVRSQDPESTHGQGQDRLRLQRMRRGLQQVARTVRRLWRLGHRSEEHTSELQSLMRITYAVFCLKKKTTKSTTQSKQSQIE